MTKYYYVRTNGMDMIVSDNGEARRVYTSFADLPQATTDRYDRSSEAKAILLQIEDDSSWELFEESADELIADGEILAEIDDAEEIEKIWYAVLRNSEDNDWGYGSYLISEAKKMAQDMDDEALIAVISEGHAPVCIETIEQEDF